MAEVVSTNQFKNGMHIQFDGQTWRIVEFQHVKPGKGGAFDRAPSSRRTTQAPSSIAPSAAGEKFERIRTETTRTCNTCTTQAMRSSWTKRPTAQLPLCRVRGRGCARLSCSRPSSVQVLFVGGRPLQGVDLPGRRSCWRSRILSPGVKGDTVIERHEARDARDRRRRPGAALRERRREDPRLAREALHQPRLNVRRNEPCPEGGSRSGAARESGRSLRRSTT